MKTIMLIENHHQVLDYWRKQKIKDLPLLHLDSHIDFGFYDARPIHQILKEAKDLRDLKVQLEKTILYKRYKEDLEAQLNIGNYIYPTMRDCIVKEFFWIVPGSPKIFASCLPNLKKFVKGIKSRDPYQEKNINITDAKISTKLYGRSFQITNIFSIQKIQRPILLDIDIDFLVFDSIKDISLIKNIGRRKPWMYPDELARLLKEKFPHIKYTTIAYSVNGGFTPIEYKFFGDEVCLRLSKTFIAPLLEKIFYLRNKAIDEYFKNGLESSKAKFEEAVGILEGYKRINIDFKSRFFAHLYFWLFKISWDRRNLESAKEYYGKAIQKDPTYRIRDNNYGWLHLEKGDLKSAYREFQKIISCDSKDVYAFCGLGTVYLRRKRYKWAQDKYRKALRLNPKNKEALLGFATTCNRLNMLKRAEDILSRLRNMEPFNSQRYMLNAELNKKKGELKKALFFYKEAVLVGGDDIKIYEDVFKILRREKEATLFKFFSRRYKTFRKNFYKNQKRILLKEKRYGQVRRLDNIFKRIDIWIKKIS